ncbi:Hypothetical predicted protein [Paramuricea clavata]|uniref:Uncharacterized protein n=1 Tax=Paramuricea clavata TaxID=317549 RepID=A0A6S7FSX0_PARCT|nr:Hypothetical predicted protein [Paramuricea clavata]
MEKDKKCNGFVKGITEHEDKETTVTEESCEQFESINESSPQEYPSSIPCQTQDDAPYQTNLFSYEDTEHHPNYHFGLIRGYHREMYEEQQPSSQQWFLCCQSLDQDTVRRIKRRNRVLSYQVTDETKEYLWRSLDIPSLYIHIIAIVGLTILTLGSALVSFCLLVPTCLGRIHGQDVPRFWCTTGDLYVKHAEEMAPNQFLYFDAALYGNFVGNPNVKKVQPELGNEKD